MTAEQLPSAALRGAAADDAAHANKDAPPNLIIFGLVLLTGIVLVVMVASLDQFFGIEIRAEIASKVLQKESAALRALRVEETDHLSTYRWVQQKDGVVQLPADLAVELYLRDQPTLAAAKTPSESDAHAGADHAATAHSDGKRAHQGHGAAPHEHGGSSR